ncbi:hypothetical protein EDD17DRAFT_1034413 [Pisolithus thermaeus]|nr:hypothetical protein EDD17DRAFT_1034413 [Pisolithus thermaeus]
MPVFHPSLCVCFHALEHLGLFALLLRINLSRCTHLLIMRTLRPTLFIVVCVFSSVIDKRKRRGRRHEQIYILRFQCQPSVSRYPLLIAMRKPDIISDIPPLASRDIIC